MFKTILSQGSSLLFLCVLTAACSTVFLFTLNYFFGLFTENLWLVFALPIFGVFSLWIDEIINARTRNADNSGWSSALQVIISSSLSQLFGASTGREGAALQYGASLGSATGHLQSKIFGFNDGDLLIRAGFVAGFSSLFGTPIAALIFLGERFGFKQSLEDSLKWTAVSFVSFYFSNNFKAQHTHYPVWPQISWDLKVLFSFLILFLIIFVAAIVYKKVANTFSHFGFKYIRSSHLRIFIAGVVIAVLTFLVGSSKYNGLGVSLIQQSFLTAGTGYEALLKSLFTLISHTFGFKGGEVTPLMSIGALLGSSLSTSLELPLIVASAVGCVFFFAQVLGIPLTGAVVMMELFGASSAPVALCFGLLLWGFKRSKFYRFTL